MASLTGSTGTVSSTGIGSGLDVNGLVGQLVAAERSTEDKRLTRVDTKLTTELTAVSQLKGSLSAFQQSLAALKSADKLAARTAQVDDEKVFTASVTSSASQGSYDIEVEQLAKAAQLASKPFVGGASSTVGTGTLTLSLGSANLSVNIDSNNNTLAGIRDAINKASGNPGIRATIVNAVDGAHLVLSGSKTGATNTLTVTQQGGDGNLAQLTYGTGNTANYSVVSSAQDSIVNIAGYEHRGTDNNITDAIDGVSIALHAEDVGETHTLTVEFDKAAVQKSVQGFVDAYNALATQIGKLRAYDASSKTAGPLLGDALLNGIESQIRRMITEPVSGASSPYNTLTSLGITTTSTGTLQLDSAKLTRALDAGSNTVADVFGSKNGVAARLDSFIASKLASGADIETRNATITTRRKDLDNRKEALEARMLVVQDRYLKQFTALDTLLTQLQSTSSYLTQQLGSLPGAANSSR